VAAPLGMLAETAVRALADLEQCVGAAEQDTDARLFRMLPPPDSRIRVVGRLASAPDLRRRTIGRSRSKGSRYRRRWGKVIRAMGVKEYAAMTGIASPNVLRAIRAGHNPTQAILDRMLRPFGLKLSAAPITRNKNRHAA
jgi:hypothetical protein